MLSSTTTTTRGAFHDYFTSGRGTKYCDERVCLSVCLPARMSDKPHTEISPWPWLGPLLTAIRYVMYFRFCG